MNTRTPQHLHVQIVTDFPKLRRRVHEQASRSTSPRSAALASRSTTEMLAARTAQLPLSGAKVNVDIGLNLELCEFRGTYDGEK